MTIDRSKTPDRIKAAACTAVMIGLFGYAFLVGLAVELPGVADGGLKLFAIAPPSSPPPIEKTVPHPVKSKRPEGAAAPPNLRATPTEIVAPPPVVRLLVIPPVVAAPTAGLGTDPSAGAANVRGPGTGAGGAGNGTGSGRAGNGDGDGGETPPRQIKGRLKNSDYPHAAGDAGIGGTVAVRFAVETDGRVTDCIVTKSSGNADLDDTTCRLIEQRFRFDPSRDEDGNPVRSYVIENHSWEIHQAPAPAPTP